MDNWVDNLKKYDKTENDTKEIFSHIYNIEFNNKRFMVLSNVKFPIYIIEIGKNGEYMYPQYEDFVNYYKMHTQNSISCILSFGLIHTDSKKGYKRGNQGKFRLIPKVIYKSILVTLASAMVLSGCAKESAVTVEDEHEELINIGRQQGMEVVFPEYDTEAPFLHENDCQEFGGKTVFCKNIDEFREEIGLTESPSYDEIIQIFEENKSIPTEFLEIIIKDLNNMKEKFPNLDLSALYCNAKKMKFIEKSDDEMRILIGKDAPAAFNFLTGEVYYNLNSDAMDEFTIVHEVLGHGAIEAIFEKEDKKMYTGFQSTLLIRNNDGKSVQYHTYSAGVMYSEGAADMIARMVTQKTQDSIYNYAEEELRIIAELTNQPIDEMFNSRGMDFYNKMGKANIQEPILYIAKTDSLYLDYKEHTLDSGKNAISDILESLVIDAAEEDVKEGGNIEWYTDILENTYFKEGIELYYYSDETSTERDIIDSYNPSESARNVKGELERIKGNEKGEGR